MNNKIMMVGARRSPIESVFAVFEHFDNWSLLREYKVLPNKAYFAVLALLKGYTADIVPNLFVQGYRPHSSGKQVVVARRRYGAFVPEGKTALYGDDLLFSQAQLYQIKGETEVELVLSDRQAPHKETAAMMVDRICAERSYAKLSDVQTYLYHCPVSAGYFLYSRSYTVWGAMVGEDVGGQLVKKMLILDYYTGIPAVVLYNDKFFEPVSL